MYRHFRKLTTALLAAALLLTPPPWAWGVPLLPATK